MRRYKVLSFIIALAALTPVVVFAQKAQPVTVQRSANENTVDITIGGKLFTSFLYPDTLEKPVLYPLHAANGTVVTVVSLFNQGKATQPITRTILAFGLILRI